LGNHRPNFKISGQTLKESHIVNFILFPEKMNPDPSRDQTGMDNATLGRRARLGVVALVIRSVILQCAVFGGNIVLARLLHPRDFGVFGIVQFVLAFFIFIGDAGLGGALIQRKDTPTQRELSSIFCLQVLIALAVIAVVWIGTPYFLRIWPDLPDGSAALIRVLSLGLLFTVLKVIPSIQMERELLFGRLAAIEVVQSLIFYASAVTLAFRGWGVWALVGSALLQMVTGAVVANALRPWRPSIVLDRALLRPLVAFGIPYQLKNVIGFINAAISPIYAGRTLGTTALGYINWAQTTGFLPVKIVEIIGRVTFPLFSRLRHDRSIFAETLGRSILLCSLGTFFLAALFCGLGPSIVRVVWSDKWLPAVPLLYVYATAITIGFVSPIVGAAFDAAGHPQIFARLSFGWTLLNWVCVIYATPRWGIIGFSVGYCVHVVLGNIALLIVMRRIVPGARVLPRILPSTIAGVVTYFLARFLASWVVGPATLAGVVLLTLAVFFAIVLAIDRTGLIQAIRLMPTPAEGKG
jgi:lipopolysaccharide exporter